MARALGYVFIICFALSASASDSDKRLRELIAQNDHLGYVIAPEAGREEYREMKLSHQGDSIEISIAGKGKVAVLKLPLSQGKLMSEEFGFKEERLVDLIEWEVSTTIEVDGQTIAMDRILFDIKDDELLNAEENYYKMDNMPPGHRILVMAFKDGVEHPSFMGGLYSPDQLAKGHLDKARAIMKKDGVVLIPFFHDPALDRMSAIIGEVNSYCGDLLKGR